MFVNPKIILNDGILTADIPLDSDQIQPNGIDLRVKAVRELDAESFFKLENDDIRINSEFRDVCENERSFCGSRGNAYLIEFYEYIIIPENLVGFIYGRSSLNRNGLFFRGSVYDSGYRGYAGGLLLPYTNFVFAKGARIAQIFFGKAECSKPYDGQFKQEFQGELG